MATETEWKLKLNEFTLRVNGYPFDRLKEFGDAVVFYGEDLNPESLRSNASTYGKRHGFKLSVIRMDTQKYRVVRVS